MWGVPSPGSQVLNNGFPSGDSHCRAGLRNLAAGTPICRHCTPTPPHPQDRTGQVGRSQRPHSKPGRAGLPVGTMRGKGGHSKLKAPGKCLRSFHTRIQRVGRVLAFVTGTVLGVFPEARRGELPLVSWTTLDRRPKRGHKKQGLYIGC